MLYFMYEFKNNNNNITSTGTIRQCFTATVEYLWVRAH